MDAIELFNKRYERRMGLNDKFDRMNKQFDSYDMIEFAEAYASQQMPSDEEIKLACPQELLPRISCWIQGAKWCRKFKQSLKAPLDDDDKFVALYKEYGYQCKCKECGYQWSAYETEHFNFTCCDMCGSLEIEMKDK